jgi:hypothetical protein
LSHSTTNARATLAHKRDGAAVALREPGPVVRIIRSRRPRHRRLEERRRARRADGETERRGPAGEEEAVAEHARAAAAPRR